MREETDKILDIMEGFAEGDDKLVKKIQDMRKLSNSRNVFYQKLITLQGETGQQQHEEQAATQEQLDEKAVEAMADVDTDGLDSFEKVRQKFNNINNAKEKSEFLSSLEKAEKKNPAVKKFMDVKRRVDGFREFVDKNGVESDNVAITPRMINSMLNDLIRKATSVEDVENLPDSMFMSMESNLIPRSSLIT